MTDERRYALMKLSAGDYALPSNDQRTIWRIARGEELSTASEELERYETVWKLWRWTGDVGDAAALAASVIEEDWEGWELVESFLPTRTEAIKAAMRFAA